MLHKHSVLASVIMLAACSPSEPSSSQPSSNESPSVEAPSAESPLAGDLRILGTEPFWAIDISRTANSANHSRIGEADVALSFPRESKGPDDAFVLTSTSPQGDVVMTLRRQDCSDGMSDRNYPWAAEVVFNGQTLKGCAATPEFIRQTPQ